MKKVFISPRCPIDKGFGTFGGLNMPLKEGDFRENKGKTLGIALPLHK